ncbi:expressed unknown protein [Seminavis robusta]|uniref:Uncharacterized protein n=1 Tax=Seminavis robusta TaxID=568900 RepID=A0A9N8ELV8_9STRA|nr:expressed unknown protein [Seminavis robusta]|eukprot:Sro1437_g272560.1 n/a (834) ;mRNA; r:15630-18204
MQGNSKRVAAMNGGSTSARAEGVSTIFNQVGKATPANNKKTAYKNMPLLALCCLMGMLLLRDRLVSPSFWPVASSSTIPSCLQHQSETISRNQTNGMPLIEDLHNDIQKLQAEVRNLQQRLSACTSELKKKESKSGDTTNTNEDANQRMKERLDYGKESLKRHPVCGKLQEVAVPGPAANSSSDTNFLIPSASFIWTQRLGEIHSATNLLPNDFQYLFHDFTAHLLQLVSSRLPRSVQTIPRSWESVQSIMDVAWKRFEYFQRHPEALVHEKAHPAGVADDYSDKDNIPRPVQIIILGGSIMQGTNCRKMVNQLQMKDLFLPLRDCCWGHRLGAFINQLFQVPLVEVTHIGIGGTNSATGTTLLQFELLPPQAAQHPDIIINGYSTNDMHSFTIQEAQLSNLTLGDQIRVMVEDFYRNATMMRHSQQDCQADGDQQSTAEEQQSTSVPPLVVHFDDYMGNEQRQILGTLEGSSTVQSLARYYGFASMSYVNVVRDWVYGDTHESWFSPAGWYPNKNSAMEREIHPQLGMHIVATWVAAYNLLHMTTTFCSLEPWRHANKGGDRDILEQSYETTRQVLSQMPPLRGDTQYVPGGKPKPPPRSLPPRLTKELSLERVSEQWEQESSLLQNQVQQQSTKVCSAGAKCPFAWVSRIRPAAIPNVTETLHKKGDVAYQAYWKAHTVSGFGGSANDESKSSWAFQSDHGKTGVCPQNGVGSKLLLEIPPPISSVELVRLGVPINSVTLFYMKSYGERWADSTVRLDVLASDSAEASDSVSDWKTLLSNEFVGYHSKNTSETYHHTIHLPSEYRISKLRLAITLVNGNTFKIMGLLACRS